MSEYAVLNQTMAIDNAVPNIFILPCKSLTDLQIPCMTSINFSLYGLCMYILTIVCRSMSKIPLLMQDAASFLKVGLDKLKKYTHFENLLNPNQRERD